MIRTIVLRFDDDKDSACLDKDNNFFLEDSIRALLNDNYTIRGKHNGVELTEIGNLEKEENLGAGELATIKSLSPESKQIIKNELQMRRVGEEEQEELINKYRVRDLHDKISNEAIRQVRNKDILFELIYKAINEYVERYYGVKEREEPHWSIEGLADYISYTLKGKM